MTIQVFSQAFTVCQLSRCPASPLPSLHFLSVTDEEISLVCPTDLTPPDPVKREDGWRMLRIAGVLDFSLIGILARIATLLAEQNISIYALSTYNTDYILTKNTHFDHALRTLQNADYEINMI